MREKKENYSGGKKPLPVDVPKEGNIKEMTDMIDIPSFPPIIEY